MTHPSVSRQESPRQKSPRYKSPKFPDKRVRDKRVPFSLSHTASQELISYFDSKFANTFWPDNNLYSDFTLWRKSQKVKTTTWVEFEPDHARIRMDWEPRLHLHNETWSYPKTWCNNYVVLCICFGRKIHRRENQSRCRQKRVPAAILVYGSKNAWYKKTKLWELEEVNVENLPKPENV